MVHGTHPAGTGPTRVSASVPDLPAADPPLKLKVSVAFAQLGNASVPVPTTWLAGGGMLGASKTPPVVSYSCTATDHAPAVHGACPVSQRCPAAPSAAPLGA